MARNIIISNLRISSSNSVVVVAVILFVAAAMSSLVQVAEASNKEEFVTLMSGMQTIKARASFPKFMINFSRDFKDADAFRAIITFRTKSTSTISALWCADVPVEPHAVPVTDHIDKDFVLNLQPSGDLLARMYNKFGLPCTAVISDIDDPREITLYNFYIQMQEDRMENALSIEPPEANKKTVYDVVDEHMKKLWLGMLVIIGTVFMEMVIIVVYLVLDNKRHGR